MRNKYHIGIAFLLTMFMALIYSSMAFAADGLAINNPSCTTAGGTAIFTISVNNAPNNISAFGLNISFDENILEFVKFNKAADLAEFMVSANKSKTLPVVTVGGYYTGSEEFGIAAGTTGQIGELVFNVLSCEPVTLAISNQTDDIKIWQAESGQLIAPIQNPPVLQAIGNKSVMLGDTVSFIAQATDADGDSISYSIADSPVGAYFGTASGEFNWTPTPGQAGTYSVTVTATDSTGKSDPETFQITVGEYYAPVVAAIAKQTVMAMSTLSLTAQATDANGDAITYSIADAPAGATFNAQTGNLIWIPTQAQVGSYSVAITATDSTGRSGSATFTIEVVLASMTMNNQCCKGGIGEEVTFTISVNGAPNEVHSLGFEVSYDENILEYKSNSKGDLTQGFELLGVSKLSSKLNTLKIGGVGAALGIMPGSNGTILNLVFTVKSCGPAILDLANLDDDIVGWSVKAGQLNVAPTIGCPGNIVVEAQGPDGTSSGNAAIQAFLNGAAASDVLGNPIGVTTNAPAVFALGNTEVTFVTVDGAGNTASCMATVGVVDTTAPAITCPGTKKVTAENATGASATNAAIQAFLKDVIATDAVGVVSTTTNAPAIFPIGTTDVTFTVADGAGNKNTCTASVTVADNTPPVITCPGNIMVEAEDANGVPANRSALQIFLNAATAMDAEDGPVIVTNNAPAQFVLGDNDVTFSAKDSVGNPATCTATVTVVDTTDPVITCPASITVEAEGANGVSAANAAIQAFLNAATATDAIDGKVNVTNNASAMIGLGSTNVTFNASDKSGNTDSCMATVTVVDTIAPAITCPASITVEAEGANGTSVGNAAIKALLNGATATDAVDGNVNVTNNAPAVFALGSTTVIFAATDTAFNTNSCTAIVTVVDTTGPAITCPANISLAADATNGLAVTNATIQAFLNGATATDKVDGTVTVTNNAPALFGLGDTVVTFIAKDKVGNTTTLTATVNVADKIAPVITCPAAITVETTSDGVLASAAKIKAFLGGAKATDAVDGAVTITNNAPAKFTVGKTEVTFSATDKSGNTNSCKSTVTITKSGTSSTGSLLGYSSSSYGNSLSGVSQLAPAATNLYQTFNSSMYSFQQQPLSLFQPSSTWNWSFNQQPTAWNFTTTLWPPAWSTLTLF